MPRGQLLQIRSGTAASWTSTNPVLAAGEPGLESDTGKEKRGDGATAWVSLPYITDVSRLPNLVANGSGHVGIDHVDMNGNSYEFGGPPFSMWQGSHSEMAASMLGARTRRNIAYSGSRACWSDSNPNNFHGGWSWVLQHILVPGMPATFMTRGWPYAPIAKLVMMEDGLNDLAALGAGNFTPYAHAHRTIIAARSLAAIWLASGADTIYGTALDAAITLKTTANWTLVQGGGIRAPTAALKNTHANAGTGYRSTSTVGETVTFTTPADLDEARVIDVCTPVAQADNYQVTVKVGATTYPAFTISGATMCDPDTTSTGAAAALNGVTLRLGSGGPTDPTSGAAIAAGTAIVVTLSALTAGTFKLSHFGLESNPLDGPIFSCLTPNRMPNATVGYSFWNTGDGFPHGNNASTFPLNDANVLTWITAQQTMEATEFPSRCITVNADTALAQDALSWNDGGASGQNINPHPNTRGRRKMASAIKSAVMASPLITDRVRTAAAIPQRDFFLDIGYVSVASYQNAWAEATFAGLFTTGPGGFTVDMNGKVRIRGVLNGAAATAATMWTMPTDLRPAGTDTVYIPARIDYTPNGGSRVSITGLIQVSGNAGTVAMDTNVLPAGMTGFPLATGAALTVSFDGTYDAEH